MGDKLHISFQPISDWLSQKSIQEIGFQLVSLGLIGILDKIDHFENMKYLINI